MRIKNHSTDTLCKQVFVEGSWPGFPREGLRICHEVALPDFNCVNVSNSEVKRVIFEHFYKDMVGIMNKRHSKFL